MLIKDLGRFIEKIADEDIDLPKSKFVTFLLRS